MVKQEVIKDEPQIDNHDTYILPDITVSGVEVKQEAMEVTDVEELTDAQIVDHGGMSERICDICSKSFTSKIRLIHHKLTVHEKPHEVGKRVCNVCHKIRCFSITHHKMHAIAEHKGKK